MLTLLLTLTLTCVASGPGSPRANRGVSISALSAAMNKQLMRLHQSTANSNGSL
jgi:hypothetical protein